MIAANKYNLIISGGASGMMEAGRTGERGLLPEKNKQLGKKILITSNDRCNMLNAIKNIISELVPTGMSKVMLTLLSGYMDMKMKMKVKVYSVTKDNRKMIVNLFKGLPITITGYVAGSNAGRK